MNESHVLAFLIGALVSLIAFLLFFLRHSHQLRVLTENRLMIEWRKGFEAGCKEVHTTPKAQ